MKSVKDTIKRFLDKHFLNRINKIDSYMEVPKAFRQKGFREQMYDRYSEMGQFFSIKSPEELYLVLLKDNGVLVAMSSMMEEVDPSDIEYDLNLNLLDIGLKDVLEDYIQDRSSEMETLKGMTESDISRLVKRILTK
jgi:hypothetical protein